MSVLSKKIQAMKPSATIAMSQKARLLLAQGVDVVNLTAGEPDFDTPDYVKQAAIDAMADGKTTYTTVDGIPELKQAICAKFKRDNGLDFGPENINVSPGGKAVIFNALAATLDPGDEVIVPAPYWVSYPEMVKLAGGDPVIIFAGPDQGFKINEDQLASAISSRTKWLMLNTPSNPTGAVYNREELQLLAGVLRDHPKVHILTDEIYEHLVYDGSFASLADVAPDLKSRTLTMNGMSKAFAMTGWRIGFAGGPETLIKAMAKVMSQTTSNPSSISQWASVAGLNGDLEFLADWQSDYKSRRDYLVDQLNRIPGLFCDKPSGAFYVFVDVREAVTALGLDNDIAFAEYLLETAHIGTVPGSAFGAPGFLRMSYATAQSRLEMAVDRLNKVLT